MFWFYWYLKNQLFMEFHECLLHFTLSLPDIPCILILTVKYKIERLNYCFESAKRLVLSFQINVNALYSVIILLSVHYHVITISSLRIFLNVKWDRTTQTYTWYHGTASSLLRRQHNTIFTLSWQEITDLLHRAT